MSIVALIDYDNLSLLDKNRGISNIAAKVVNALPKSDIQGKRNISLRFYGGWYLNSNLTTKAQQLTQEINANFPCLLPVSSTSSSIIVKVELAQALILTPNEAFESTYRNRDYPADLKCKSPASLGCRDSNCPVNHVYNFISSGSCSGQTCNIRPENLIYRGQQKLVDIMLALDMLYLSFQNSTPLVIVSSDDDFWPSIRFALEMGSKVIHLHTHIGRNTPRCYSRFATPSYVEKNF